VDFLQVLRFPCQFSLSLMLHIHPSSGASKIGPLVAGVPNGLSLTPYPLTKYITKEKTLAYNSVSSKIFCRNPGFRDMKIRKLY
jgi:hypothetical protein